MFNVLLIREEHAQALDRNAQTDKIIMFISIIRIV